MEKLKIHCKKITETRNDHGLSESELAMISGLSEDQILALENSNGENYFVEEEHRIDCVKRVAEALGINHDQFLMGAIIKKEKVKEHFEKENRYKSENNTQLSEIDELERQIIELGFGKFHNFYKFEEILIKNKTTSNGNSKDISLIGPLLLIFLLLFFYLLNFV